jgi:RNA polymerase-binding transcription factor DksA
VEISVARKRLEEMREELDRSIAVLRTQGAGSVEGYPQDAADAGASLSEADRTEAILDSARGQRAEVLAALARIQDSSFGLCVDCRTPIPDGRIEARPDAARCVNCQARYARRMR